MKEVKCGIVSLPDAVKDSPNLEAFECYHKLQKEWYLNTMLLYTYILFVMERLLM